MNPAMALGTFDDIAHHQPVGQMHLFMLAEPVGGKKLVIFGMADRSRAIRMVKAHHVVCVNIGCTTAGLKLSATCWGGNGMPAQTISANHAPPRP